MSYSNILVAVAVTPESQETAGKSGIYRRGQ